MIKTLNQATLLNSFVFTCCTFFFCNLSIAKNNPLRLQGPHSERVHQTSIHAILDAKEHRVDATMQLEWTNLTGQAAVEHATL